MRFQDGVHGHVRILAVYGTADHSKKAKAGEKMTGAVERLAVAEWLRTQGEEARGKRLRPEKVLPMVDIEDTVAGGARADSGPEGEGSSAAAIVQAEQAEPLMVIGDLNCAPAPADRLSLVKGCIKYSCTDADKEEDSLVSVCLDLGLADLWRVKHPDCIAYTYTDAPLAQGGSRSDFTGARCSQCCTPDR